MADLGLVGVPTRSGVGGETIKGFGAPSSFSGGGVANFGRGGSPSLVTAGMAGIGGTGSSRAGLDARESLFCSTIWASLTSRRCFGSTPTLRLFIR